jgi:hypothetical protein
MSSEPMTDRFWLETADREIAELTVVIASPLPDDMARRAALEYLNDYAPLEDR